MRKISRYIFLVCAFIVTGSISFANIALVDSLKQQLENLSSSQQIPVLLHIAEELNYKDLNLSIKYANEALALANNEKDKTIRWIEGDFLSFQV